MKMKAIVGLALFVVCAIIAQAFFTRSMSVPATGNVIAANNSAMAANYYEIHRYYYKHNRPYYGHRKHYIASLKKNKEQTGIIHY